MIRSVYQETRPDCITENFHTSGRQKKTDCFIVDEYQCLKLWDDITTSVPNRRLVAQRADEVIEREYKILRVMDDL